MELESVTLKLPRDLLSGAQRVASAREITIGHMVRQLLKREVARQLSTKRNEATYEHLLAALQALLARDMAEALDWDDLAARLCPHGYDMREISGGVALYKTSCGTRVCKGSELGFSYAALCKRFGAEMPAHPTKKRSVGIMPAGNIDPIRHKLFCGHITAARSWPDLINRLACEGIELRLLGTALGLHNAATGRHLCNSGDVGAVYDDLVRRFGGRLPNDPVANITSQIAFTPQE